MSFDIANIFTPDNALFEKAVVTGHVNSQPYVPEHTSAWFPWNSEGVTSKNLIIEFNEGSLGIVPEAPRGAPGHVPERDVRSGVPVIVPHFPTQETLLATQFEGVRAFGSELYETVEMERNKLLARINRRNRLMWEVSRIGAITGLVIDHNGNIRQNWFNAFGKDGVPLVQTTHDVDFASSNTNIRSELIAARDKAEEQLGDLTATGYVAICGKNRFASITDHPKFEKAFERYNDGSALRDDLSGGFLISSDITVKKYTRAKVGGISLIGDDDMFIVPIADGMFQTRFAPGTGMSDLGSTGLPEYVSTHLLPHDEGAEFKGQTNVVSWIERLLAVCKVRQG